MNLKQRFLIFAILVILIATWSTNFNAEGAKNLVPTTTPTGFIASAVSPTQINLSWLAPTQNYGKIIVGYKIDQRLSTGVYDTVVDNTGNTITTYSMTGLKTGISYTYRVSAVYSDDASTDPSNPSTATPSLTSTQTSKSDSSPMTNVRFDFVPSDGTTLAGVIVSPNDYLQLQYKKDPRSVLVDVTHTADSVNNNLDGLILYQNKHPSPDSVPAPLIAKSNSSTQITLSWLPPLESYNQKLIGYKIELKDSLGEYQTIDDNTGNDTTKYIITGLTPDNTYTYRVLAVYPGTHSNPSNEVSVTTLTMAELVTQKPNQTTTTSPPNSSETPKISPPLVAPVVNNVRLDFTAPDGNTLSGRILTQNDYQQFVVIKDPRTILSNVSQTSAEINDNLAGLIRYQDLHPVQQPPEKIQTTPVSNLTETSNNSSIVSNKSLFDGVITSVVASAVVGLITWFVKTKVARKIAKEYHFTLDKFSTEGEMQIRIRNSGETIENCIVLCEGNACIWSDTKLDKPKHIYEGSIASAQIPLQYENKNPLISVKSGKKMLKKMRLDDMAHG